MMDRTTLHTIEDNASHDGVLPGGRRLDEMVSLALGTVDIDGLLYSNRGFFPAFMATLSETLGRAFEGDDDDARKHGRGLE